MVALSLTFAVLPIAVLAFQPSRSNLNSIDVVIPHSMGASSLVSDDVQNPERDRDPGDLKYQLRSFAQYAPWINHIYIMVDGDHAPADWFAEPAKTSFVNRCALPGLVGNCPTRNSQAVATVAQQIPGLSELFIYTDDDDLLVKPAHVEQFFDLATALPYNNAWSKEERMYDDEANVLKNHPELRAEDIPRRMHKMDPGHTFVPVSKSSLLSFEQANIKWVNFVRGHTNGRYCSHLDAHGTSESEASNCLEEEVESAWYWHFGKHPEFAAKLDPKTHPSSESVYDGFSSPAENVEETIHRAQEKPDDYIANLNDRYAHDPKTFQQQVRAVHQVLEKFYPPPASLLASSSHLRGGQGAQQHPGVQPLAPYAASVLPH